MLKRLLKMIKGQMGRTGRMTGRMTGKMSGKMIGMMSIKSGKQILIMSETLLMEMMNGIRSTMERMTTKSKSMRPKSPQLEERLLPMRALPLPPSETTREQAVGCHPAQSGMRAPPRGTMN